MYHFYAANVVVVVVLFVYFIYLFIYFLKGALNMCLGRDVSLDFRSVGLAN